MASTMAIWKGIRPYVSSLIRFFHISYIETKSRQRGSHLGILWIPLTSLIFSVVLALIFRHSDTMSPTVFVLYVLAGYTLWTFIAESINGSTDVIQSQLEFGIHNNLTLVGLFGKLLVDRLFEYSLNLALLAAMVLALRPTFFGPQLALIIPFLALIVVTSIGTAYLVNLGTIFFPDTTNLFKVFTRFMFFTSPVFWSAADRTSGPRVLLMQYNPVSYFLSLPRQAFGIEPFEPGTWLVAFIFSAITCSAAYLAYHYSQGIVRNLK